MVLMSTSSVSTCCGCRCGWLVASTTTRYAAFLLCTACRKKCNGTETRNNAVPHDSAGVRAEIQPNGIIPYAVPVLQLINRSKYGTYIQIWNDIRINRLAGGQRRKQSYMTVSTVHCQKADYRYDYQYSQYWYRFGQFAIFPNISKYIYILKL